MLDLYIYVGFLTIDMIAVKTCVFNAQVIDHLFSSLVMFYLSLNSNLPLGILMIRILEFFKKYKY